MANVLQLDQQDVNLSVEYFLNNMNSILDEHAPLKWINKYKSKLLDKKTLDNPCHSEIYHCQKQIVKKVLKYKRFTNKRNFS